MEKTKKAYEIVIDSIKEQIMNQELVLGQGLPPEREISEKLGVSRNSVREALKILTVMGVVSSRQGAGNYISGNFKGYMVDALSMMSLNRSALMNVIWIIPRSRRSILLRKLPLLTFVILCGKNFILL